MGRKKKQIPKYGTVTLNGIEYFRTRIEDADGKRVALYAKTAEELYEKVEEAKRQIEEASFRRATPTVAEYCERWLLMQSAHIRTTTLTDYSSKVKNYIFNTFHNSTNIRISIKNHNTKPLICHIFLPNGKICKMNKIMVTTTQFWCKFHIAQTLQNNCPNALNFEI